MKKIFEDKIKGDQYESDKSESTLDKLKFAFDSAVTKLNHKGGALANKEAAPEGEKSTKRATYGTKN